MLAAAVFAAPLLCCCLLPETAASPASVELPSCHGHAQNQVPAETESDNSPPVPEDCDCPNTTWQIGQDEAVVAVFADSGFTPLTLTAEALPVTAPRPPLAEPFLIPRAPHSISGHDRCVLHAVFLI